AGWSVLAQARQLRERIVRELVALAPALRLAAAPAIVPPAIAAPALVPPAIALATAALAALAATALARALWPLVPAPAFLTPGRGVRARRQRDAPARQIHVDHPHLDLVAHLHDLARILHEPV